MVTFILRSNKLVNALGWFCLMLMIHEGDAYDFIVGGQKGWSVPSDSTSNPLNQWAEKSRFQIGDSLVFNYQSGKDSVLYVKNEDYASCNTGSPYAKFSDGHTIFKLNQSGPHFFISGNKDNCDKNEKLTVIVLSDRGNGNSSSNSNRTSNASTPSPSPSPQSSSPPSPAPSNQEGQSPPPETSQTPSPPSPAPSNQEGQSPPPETSQTPSPPSPAPSNQEGQSPPPETSQTPPPTASSDDGHPPRNGAASVFVSLASSAGTFMASVLILSKYV